MYVVFTVGITVALTVFTPELQLYVVAPLAVNKLLLPSHTVTGLLTALIDGNGNAFTVIVFTAEELHPA